jgi:AraC family transcriptional activator of pobA
MANNFGDGISIERMLFSGLSNTNKQVATFEEADQPHRHDAHSFFLLESGTVDIEIDFEHYLIGPGSVLYVHPDQVHHTIASENVIVSSWAITNENLNPEYLKLLESIRPAKPIVLNTEAFTTLAEAVALGLKISERKHDKLYHSILKDSCNALVALVVSKYLELADLKGKPSRYDVVTNAFKEILERDYMADKRPAAYARKLHLSTPYLNECVKNATGHSVSYHIQQRVVLEAKRLLYHSSHSVKEIAASLGYDDYPYFSRLFSKVTGMTALAFRGKNHE